MERIIYTTRPGRYKVVRQDGKYTRMFHNLTEAMKYAEIMAESDGQEYIVYDTEQQGAE